MNAVDRNCCIFLKPSIYGLVIRLLSRIRSTPLVQSVPSLFGKPELLLQSSRCLIRRIIITIITIIRAILLLLLLLLLLQVRMRIFLIERRTPVGPTQDIIQRYLLIHPSPIHSVYRYLYILNLLLLLFPCLSNISPNRR